MKVMLALGQRVMLGSWLGVILNVFIFIPFATLINSIFLMVCGLILLINGVGGRYGGRELIPGVVVFRWIFWYGSPIFSTGRRLGCTSNPCRSSNRCLCSVVR